MGKSLVVFERLRDQHISTPPEQASLRNGRKPETGNSYQYTKTPLRLRALPKTPWHHHQNPQNIEAYTLTEFWMVGMRSVWFNLSP